MITFTRMSHSHGITKCSQCDMIIMQCRCFNHNTVNYAVCDGCKKGTTMSQADDVPPYIRHVKKSDDEQEVRVEVEERMLHWFKYDHLPAELRAVSKPFCELAQHVVDTLDPTPERTVTLRKLLEAKDAAMRASIEAKKLTNRGIR